MTRRAVNLLSPKLLLVSGAAAIALSATHAFVLRAHRAAATPRLWHAGQLNSRSAARPPERLSRARVGPQLRPALDALGDRLVRPGKERLTMTGTLTRGGGRASPFVFIREFPDRLRLEVQEGVQRQVLIYNGRATGRGNYSDSELATIKTLVLDTPDHFFWSRERGAGLRFLGTRFRLDDGGAPDYAGPFYDVYQVIDREGLGVHTLPHTRLYYFNSDTLLPERVRYETERSGTAVQVEVLMTEWRKAQGQQVPSRIERLEDGRPVLRLDVTSTLVGPRAEDGIFGS